MLTAVTASIRFDTKPGSSIHLLHYKTHGVETNSIANGETRRRRGGGVIAIAIVVVVAVAIAKAGSK